MGEFLEGGYTAAGAQRCRAVGRRLLVATVLGFGLWSGTGGADAPAKPDTAQGGANYAIGYQFGGYLAGLQDQGLDLEAVFRGVLDALSGVRPRMSAAEMRAALAGIEGARAGSKATSRTSTNVPVRARGYIDDYAALNAKRPGVVVLPSGLQYEVLKAGDGKQPGPQDIVAVNYRGFLADGVGFDSTDADSGPAHLQVDQIVVQGLREAILLMRVGDNWRVTIPAALGFTRGKMLRKRDLIYEIELVAIEAPPGDP